MYHLSLQVVLLRMIYSTSTAIANAFALFWGPLILLWMAYWAERSQLQTTCFLGLWYFTRVALEIFCKLLINLFLANYSAAQLMCQFHGDTYDSDWNRVSFTLKSSHLLCLNYTQETLIPYLQCQNKGDCLLIRIWMALGRFHVWEGEKENTFS